MITRKRKTSCVKLKLKLKQKSKLKKRPKNKKKSIDSFQNKLTENKDIISLNSETYSEKEKEKVLHKHLSIFPPPTVYFLDAKYSILVLGMANVLINDFKFSQNPLLRDKRRIKALEKYFHPKSIYSMAEISFNCATELTHFNHLFGERAIHSIHKKFPKLQFDLILGDYFRFPSQYMREAYSQVCPNMLNALIAKNMLVKGGKVILPVPQDPFYCDLKKFAKTIWTVSYIKPEENPLYFITNLLSTEELLGYNNDKQIQNNTKKNAAFIQFERIL